MIAAWMLYNLVIGGLVLIAAVPIERYVLARGGETRRVWVGALLGAVALPVLAVVLRDAPPAFEMGNHLVPTTTISGVVMEGVLSYASLDAFLGWSWLGASLVLSTLLMGGALSTYLRSRSWRPARVEGHSVHVSDTVGPAVVGAVRPRIVLPQWVLQLSDSERLMVLRHEQEHLKARDPLLVFLGAGFVTLLPWHLPVWEMVRRLRVAIEVDCDRRVVRGGTLNVRRYAELLIAVGTRRSVPAYGVGFSVGRPPLEQRIDRMTMRASPRHPLQAALLVLGLAGVVAAAWSVPQPVRAAKVTLDFEACVHWGSPDFTRAILDGWKRAT